MLPLTIKSFKLFDERTESFIQIDHDTYLEMENSLVAIAKWEEKYHKPWFEKENKNPYIKDQKPTKSEEEMRYFMKCMITNIPFNEIDDRIFYGLTQSNAEAIGAYLQDPHGADPKVPPVKEDKKKRASPLFTADRIYAILAEQQIPWDIAEKWNINRVLRIIEIINYDNTPDDKKKKPATYKETAEKYKNINEQRLKQLGKTKG